VWIELISLNGTLPFLPLLFAQLQRSSSFPLPSHVYLTMLPERSQILGQDSYLSVQKREMQREMSTFQFNSKIESKTHISIQYQRNLLQPRNLLYIA